jgi:hypothetical protein
MAATLRIAAGVSVEASAEQVWDLAVDWSRQHEWIWATRTEGGHGEGAVVTGWTGVGPLGFSDSMVVTEWDPPRRCTVTHTGRVVRGTGLFEVVPRDGRCELRWTERITLPLALPPVLEPLALAVIGAVARFGLGTSLIRFARLLRPGG